MKVSSPVTTAGLVLLAGIALGLSGCDDDDGGSADAPKPNGVEELAAAKIVAASVKATRGTSDLTYEGTMTYGYEAGPQKVHTTTVVTDHGACETRSSGKGAGRTTLRLVHGVSYLKGDDTALRAGFGFDDATIDVLRGKWISTPADAGSKADCKILEYSAASVDKGSCKKGGETTVDDQPVVVLKCEEDGRRVTMSVATVGDPVVLRVVGATDDGPFDLTLTGRDEGADVVAPPRKQVIDTAQDG